MVKSSLANAVDMTPSYKLLRMIPIPPGNCESFDFSWIDSGSQSYYLTDRTNRSIDIFDASEGKFIAAVKGFVGFTGMGENSGPNGLEVLPDLNQAWAGDGDSTVKVIDLETNEITASIPTGGGKRVDLLACDPKDKIILAINDKENPPFITFISAVDFAVLGRIKCPQVTFGPEQPVWSREDNRFFMAVTQTSNKLGGEVYVIDPLSMKVVDTFDGGGCCPVGLALGPDHHLLLGGGGLAIPPGVESKSAVMDARDGRIIAAIPQVGGIDQAWFNAGDNRFYVAASAMTSNGTKQGQPAPVMGVIDAVKAEWLANVPTGRGAHSIAANPNNNHVWVPIKGSGIAVFAEVT